MKSDYVVVVADGTRARFFTLESAAQRSVESSPSLIEHDDLVNAEHDQGGRDKYSSTRTGLGSNPHGRPSHGFDDHRDRHEQAHEGRFAHDVTARAVSLAQQHHAAHLVLAAEKHMLGLLRDALNIPVKSGIEVHELAKDLTKFSPFQVHDHIAAAGVVPERQGPKVG